MRKVLLAGNWKMNKLPSEVPAFFQAYSQKARLTEAPVRDRVELLFAVPYPLLAPAVAATQGLPVTIAAQNVHQERAGAYTGEVSIDMLKDLGVGATLIGHSERRQYYGETDAIVAQKLRLCLDQGLQPIVCIGETKEEREGGQTEGILQKQMAALFDQVAQWQGITIAYEPVWAIGTGLTATDEQAQQAHSFVRELIRQRYNQEAAAATRILYGGSMKPANCAGLLQQPDIDGGLVGGASLKEDDFAAMTQTALEFTKQ
jgi:triosephosphate isomerase